ncbi:MAG: shikimate kinase [Thiothrix sp.]|nr:shikimate kinase [Thiothrix sp.]HPE59196.1 shikimate kinase [Thiolinea sp.]
MQANIILVGLMGAGKSTVGRQLARHYRLDFHDSDKVIEQRTGVNIPTIFEIEGEEGFREREAQVIRELCSRKGIVLATGGGSVLRADNRASLKAGGTVIYLKASAEQLYARIGHDRNRPLMQTENPLATLQQLLQKREAWYAEVADIILPTGKQRVAQLVRTLSHRLSQLQAPLPHENAQS